MTDPYGDSLDYAELDGYSVSYLKCCPKCRLYYRIEYRHVCLGPASPTFCECGCGQLTAAQLKGRQYSRWCRGHNNRGRGGYLRHRYAAQ